MDYFIYQWIIKSIFIKIIPIDFPYTLNQNHGFKGKIEIKEKKAKYKRKARYLEI